MMTRIGGFCAQHGAHLHRRGVRAQQHPRAVRLRREVERVVHLAGRMALGEIQLGEVVVVGLDVRTFGDGEAHVGEDRGELVHHLADRMHAARFGRRLAHRQRDVHGLGGEPRVERRALEAFAARVERRVDAVLEPVDRRALHLALVRRHAAQRLEQRRDRAALAERSDPHGFERGLVGGRGDGGRNLGFQGGNVGHSSPRGECGWLWLSGVHLVKPLFGPRSAVTAGTGRGTVRHGGRR